jgi:putative Mg2+ transporter-C (MgtC) family protein
MLVLIGRELASPHWILVENLACHPALRPPLMGMIRMMGMPVHIGWYEIALRLILTVVAGLLIGYNRTEHGKAAGLRTTVLVCLAASLAMIQVNLLLPTAGRSPDSFVMNDLMRLPLGILTGVGFIGAGAIIRRDNIVVGVTTAATLWYVTVIGLCLGGGQIELGVAATVVGFLALWLLNWIESRLRRECRASLYVELEGAGLSERQICRMLETAGLGIARTDVTLSNAGNYRKVTFHLAEYRLPNVAENPSIVDAIAAQQGVVRLEWKRL